MRKSSGIIITVIQASSIMYSVHSPNTYVLFYTDKSRRVACFLIFGLIVSACKRLKSIVNS